MKNTIGHVLQLTIFGESHGEMIGCVLDGLPSGIEVNLDYIHQQLQLRHSVDAISTARKEKDSFRIVSGVKDGYTEGTPIAILIDNKDVDSSAYKDLEYVLRPSHADYTGELRYQGYQDKRGGGHFSGRLTAAIVAAGAIVRYALEKRNILIGSHIEELYGIKDTSFSNDSLQQQLQQLNQKEFAVIDGEIEKEMMHCIQQAKEEKDSLGGILETVICNYPSGIGEPMFGSLESRIAEAIYSIPAVKGISFGSGFALGNMKGSEANDSFVLVDGTIQTKTNHNGGVNGGITNGMPIVFHTVIKPTPSIGIVQKTVDMKQKEETTLEIVGRHDPAIIHRARVVVDCFTAFVLGDLLCETYGHFWPLGDQ